MSVRLEEQIRRYTEVIDSITAPVEELIPFEMASRLGIEQRPSVDISVSLGVPQRRQRLPGWAYGLITAVVVFLLAIPLWLLLSNPTDDPADAPPAVTTAPFPPVESDDPFFLRAESGGVVTGIGWLPSSPITFAVNGLEGDESVDADAAGRFNFPLASIGLRFGPGDTLTATDGTTTRQILIPVLTVDIFDPDLGIASGSTPLPDDTPVELIVAASGGTELLLRLQTTVQAGTWSFIFEPISPVQTTTESWISVHSGDGPYDVRLEP